MKKINFAKTTIMILVLFFVIYNSIGWNKLPINEVEKLVITFVK